MASGLVKHTRPIVRLEPVTMLDGEPGWGVYLNDVFLCETNTQGVHDIGTMIIDTAAQAAARDKKNAGRR